MNQPLTSITLNGESLKLYLREVPLQLDEAHSAAEEMIAASYRISKIINDIGNLFGKTKREPSAVHVNDLAIEALRILHRELRVHKVATRVELTSGLPPVMGHRGQLQEVVINLIQNAIDAMEVVSDEQRELQVKTECWRGDAIKLTIADTGPGIDSKTSGEIFEAFFTTKSDGMGLGLAICRMIIERHGGQLTASPASPHGAIFKIILPQSKPE